VNQTSMNRKILITGGLGYIGARLALHLRSLGAAIWLMTRRSLDDYPAWCRGSDIQVVRGDLQNRSELNQLCDGMDSVIHLAAMHHSDCAGDPVSAVAVNGRATVKLLQAAKRCGVERFVYFSTIHVYGTPLIGTINETSLPRPNNAYSITHRLAEDFVLSAHDHKEIAGVVLRLSNGVGAPVDPDINQWGLVVNDLCRQAVQDGKLVLKSSGLQQRDFVTLFDVERVVEHFLNKDVDQWDDGLFNVGGENSISIYSVSQMIATRALELFHIKVPVERPSPEEGEKQSSIDYRIDKLKTSGFTIHGSLQNEIDETLKMCHKTFSGK